MYVKDKAAISECPPVLFSLHNLKSLNFIWIRTLCSSSNDFPLGMLLCSLLNGT